MSIPIDDANEKVVSAEEVENEVASASQGAEATPEAEAAAEAAEAEEEVLEAEILEPEDEAGEPAAEADEAAAGETDEEAVMAEAEAVLAAAEELEAVKAQLAEAQSKYMRLHAEWDTYRRRMDGQRAEEKKLATQKLVDNMLPVLDDFERTIDYGEKNDGAGMLEGTKAVYNKLVDTLCKSGVEVINPEGEAYNALEAQAVQMVEDTTVPDETVTMVFQKGYKMGNKVLRPATVVISTGGPKREVEED